MPRSRVWLGLAIAFLSFALYAHVVRLPNFYDDAVEIPALAGRDYLGVFGVLLNNYYRPLRNVLWLAVRDVTGWFLPAGLHWLNLAGHMLNTALVYALARRLVRPGKSPWYAPMAALIFGLFPLSFEAVVWSAALAHMLAAGFGLAAALAYVHARRTATWGGVLLSCGLIVAGVLSHDAGAAYALLIPLIEVAIGARDRGRFAAILPVATAVASTLAFRALVPRDLSANALHLGALWANGLYYSQGMSLWAMVVLRSWLGLIGLPTGSARDLILLGMFAGSLALGLVAAARYRPMLVPALLGLAWWGIAALIPAVSLDPAYVVTSPRLNYMPALGSALFWAAAVAGLTHKGSKAVAISVGVAAAGLLAWSAGFARARVDELARLGAAWGEISRSVRGTPANAQVVLVNMPWWNAPRYPAFLLGNEGIQIYQHGGTEPASLLAAQQGDWRSVVALRRGDQTVTSGDFAYARFGDLVDDAGVRSALVAPFDIYRFDYDAPGLRAVRIGGIGLQDPASVGPTLSEFTSGDFHARLVGVSAERCGSRVTLQLDWVALGNAPKAPLAIFVHGQDGAGHLVFNADRDLLDGILPMDAVPPRLLVEDVRQITLPDHSGAPTKVLIGIYARDTGARLSARRSDGTPWPEDSAVVPITPCTP